VNVFVDGARARDVLHALPVDVVVTDRDIDAALADGQVRVWWDETPVDVHDLHHEVAVGVRQGLGRHRGDSRSRHHRCHHRARLARPPPRAGPSVDRTTRPTHLLKHGIASPMLVRLWGYDPTIDPEFAGGRGF
jgi:hypothetical protein